MKKSSIFMFFHLKFIIATFVTLKIGYQCLIFYHYSDAEYHGLPIHILGEITVFEIMLLPVACCGLGSVANV